MKKQRIVGRPPRYPLAVEAAYRGDILRIVSGLDAAARAEVAAHGQELLAADQPRRDAADHRQDAWVDLLAMMLLRIALAISSQLMDAERLIRFRALSAAAFTDRDWRATVRRHYGVDVTKGAPGLEALLRGFEIENLALIRSVPERYVERLRGEFTKAVLEGRGLRDLTAMVRDATGASRARSELIARDQLGRLTGQMQRLRQEAIGVESFLWMTMADERVRPTHRVRHGKEYRWDEPGIKPGSEIRCRCSAAPILPGLTAEDIRGLG